MVGLPGNQLARLEFTTQLATAAASTHPAKVHLLKPRSDLITFGPCDFFGCDATKKELRSPGVAPSASHQVSVNFSLETPRLSVFGFGN